MMMKRFFLIAGVALFVTGCAAQPTKPPMKAPVCVASGTWYDPDLKVSIPNADLLKQLKDKDVVILGETHDVMDHHRWQLQTMSQLYAQRPDLVLGFESFPRRVQPVLDAWVAGNLSEAEFLKQSDWDTVWKFDPKLYLDLFHFARINRIPMIALNVDRSLTNKISKLGWKAIPQKDRLGLSDPKAPSQDYLDMLNKVYAQHVKRGNGKNENQFSNFVDVQVTWDRAMAEAIATTVKPKPNRQMVVIVGRGHSEFKFGIPHQLQDLGLNNVSVLSPWDMQRPCSDLQANLADAVFGLDIQTKAHTAPKPKLGIMIDTAKDGGAQVRDVMENSLAKTAGILKNDIIIKAAGHPIKTSGDLIKVIQSMPPGTWLPLTLKRDEQTLDVVARFPDQP